MTGLWAGLPVSAHPQPPGHSDRLQLSHQISSQPCSNPQGSLRLAHHQGPDSTSCCLTPCTCTLGSGHPDPWPCSGSCPRAFAPAACPASSHHPPESSLSRGFPRSPPLSAHVRFGPSCFTRRQGQIPGPALSPLHVTHAPLSVPQLEYSSVGAQGTVRSVCVEPQPPDLCPALVGPQGLPCG